MRCSRRPADCTDTTVPIAFPFMRRAYPCAYRTLAVLIAPVVNAGIAYTAICANSTAGVRASIAAGLAFAARVPAGMITYLLAGRALAGRTVPIVNLRHSAGLALAVVSTICGVGLPAVFADLLAVGALTANGIPHMLTESNRSTG